MRYLSVLSATLLAVPLPASATAQVMVVDEGSFTLRRGSNGPAVGRETFAIRRTPGPGGDVYVASGTVELDGRQLAPALRTDASFAPLAYQIEVRVGNQVRERLKGLAGRGRFSAQVSTPAGESTKEYIISDGAVILDDDVVHQYYFLAQRALRMGPGDSMIPVVIPQQNAQEMIHVQWAAGDDRLAIGGRPVETRQLVLTRLDGHTDRLWVDAAGHVLKASLNGGKLIATRDDPPR